MSDSEKAVEEKHGEGDKKEDGCFQRSGHQRLIANIFYVKKVKVQSCEHEEKECSRQTQQQTQRSGHRRMLVCPRNNT